jgi:mono/diheme cytochrome c family protein
MAGFTESGMIMSAATSGSCLFRCARIAFLAVEIIVCERTFASAAQESTTATQEKTRPLAASAAIIKIYRDLCLQCHDNDGRGEVIRGALPKVPNFADPNWQASRGDDDLRRSILEGKGKTMPSMKGKLRSVDVMKMIAFVRAFQNGKQTVEDEPEESTASAQPTSTVEPGPAMRKDVRGHEISRLYNKLCSTCHGPNGRGAGMRASLPTIPDFIRAKWHESRSDLQLNVSIRDGKGAGMPSFRDKLDREQIRDLVAFVRTFDRSYTGLVRTGAPDLQVRFRRLEEEFENLRKQSPSPVPPTSTTKSNNRPGPTPSIRRDVHR